MSDDPEKQLAAALGRVPSGIYVLTLRRHKTETGMLASWVQQCSFHPPQVCLAVNPERPLAALLTPEVPFTLNILESGQTDMVGHFGRGFALEDEPFKELEVVRDGPGGPVLAEALAVLECKVANRVQAGDHDLFVAQVYAGRLLGDGQPMVHIRKNGFHY